MNFQEYQELAHRTSGSESSIEMSALGLAGEAGEVADLVKKHKYHGHSLPTIKLVEELGDILWYIAEACTTLGLSLGGVAYYNIRKLQGRYPEGFSSERSINRHNEETEVTTNEFSELTESIELDKQTEAQIREKIMEFVKLIDTTGFSHTANTRHVSSED